MKIQLIKGEFNSGEAIELISQMIQLKIKYHENKIRNHSNEEDIKNREAKIKRLHTELSDLRKAILLKGNNVNIDGVIQID